MVVNSPGWETVCLCADDEETIKIDLNQGVEIQNKVNLFTPGND